ncbi:MAG TPA: Crp/Fnr family transcriptional regulator, partial [Caldimonas sp.]
MPATALQQADAPRFSPAMLRSATSASVRPADRHAIRSAADTLRLLSERLVPRRRIVHAGDV